jgi:predicted transcriptional regulator
MTAATVEHEIALAVVSQPQPETTPQLAAQQPPAPSPPPAPKKVTRSRYNGFRHSPARVKDLRRVLPRQVPRLRDLRIYEYVVFEEMSQHDVAQIFDVTQPRVCQIVQEVRAWLSTVPWEFPGMTDEQQMNLATHETRRWLEVIRKKSLAGHEKTDAQCETIRSIENQAGFVRREKTYRTQPPTSGFLKVAMQAVVKAGELGGAGQQWPAISRQSTAESPQSTAPTPPSAIPDSGERPISEFSTRLLIAYPLRASDLGRLTGDSRLPDSLLKENRIRFSPQNGKANGHKTSLPRTGASREISSPQGA